MSLYGRLFAAGYDRLMAGQEKADLGDHRKALLGRVGGHVIEIGGGTGANLPFYGPGVEELVITEPEEPMARRLERKLAAYSLPARVVRAPAEGLPLEDQSFDFAVSTLVLCTVRDPARALSEVRRLLRPGGRLLSSSTCARTTPGSRAGRTVSTASSSASDTAATATGARWRTSRAPGSGSRTSSTTASATRHRFCAR
jgi:ubiquinone/menaquinone biosynthesis C-methylase UbiE